jgi:hypothetical protein
MIASFVHRVGMEAKHPVTYDVGGLTLRNVSLSIEHDRAFMLLASREGGFTGGSFVHGGVQGDVSIALSQSAEPAVVCRIDAQTFGRASKPRPALVARCHKAADEQGWGGAPRAKNRAGDEAEAAASLANSSHLVGEPHTGLLH